MGLWSSVKKLAGGVGDVVGIGSGILGLGSSLFGGKKKQKAGEQAYGKDIGLWREQIAKQEEWQKKYADIFGQYARWQPKERTDFMRAASGVFSQREKALKREGAKSIAGRGTGGGSYGRMAERINRDKVSQVAQALQSTYGPKATPSAGPWSGVPGSGTSAPTYSASGEFLQGAGELGGKLTSMWGMDKWGKKLFPNTFGGGGRSNYMKTSGMAMPSSWGGSAGAMF